MYILFVDDVLLFGGGGWKEWRHISDIIYLFCKASGMEVNSKKSCFIAPEGVVDHQINDLLPFPKVALDDGFTYLGFSLKPNGYGKKDWV